MSVSPGSLINRNTLVMGLEASITGLLKLTFYLVSATAHFRISALSPRSTWKVQKLKSRETPLTELVVDLAARSLDYQSHFCS